MPGKAPNCNLLPLDWFSWDFKLIRMTRNLRLIYVVFLFPLIWSGCSLQSETEEPFSFKPGDDFEQTVVDSENIHNKTGIENESFDLGMLPPIPDPHDGTVSEQLEYILKTDHQDRLKGYVFQDFRRDSIRLETVKKWYQNDQIKTWEDKYNAAFIFIHAGGPLYRQNTECYETASRLFLEVSKESADKAIQLESKALALTAFNKYLNAKLNEEISKADDPILKDLPVEVHVEMENKN
jgi:hypothetical protein